MGMLTDSEGAASSSTGAVFGGVPALPACGRGLLCMDSALRVLRASGELGAMVLMVAASTGLSSDLGGDPGACRSSWDAPGLRSFCRPGDLSLGKLMDLGEM